MYYFTGKREPGQAWILPLKGEPVWTRRRSGQDRAGLARYRGCHGHVGTGRAGPLRHLRRTSQGSAGAGSGERDAGDGRLPHDQIAGRDRAPAARQRYHHRSLQGGARHPARRHVAARSGRQHLRRIPRARHRRGGDGHLRQVHRVPARQHTAAATARRRHGADRRRLHRGGLSERHHAHHRIRQADQAAARSLGPRAPGAGRRAGGGETRRGVRERGRGGAQGDHRRGLRSRATRRRDCRIAPATASASTATNGPTS